MFIIYIINVDRNRLTTNMVTQSCLREANLSDKLKLIADSVDDDENTV